MTTFQPGELTPVGGPVAANGRRLTERVLDQ